MSKINQVEQFMLAGGQAVPQHPTVPNREAIAFRFRLNLEEEIELAEALGSKSEALQALQLELIKAVGKVADLIKEEREEEPKWDSVMDAFADKDYVLKGQIITFGLKTTYDSCFDMVHKCNMSKFCKTVVEAEESVKAYADKGEDAYYEELNGNYVIKRSYDKKVLKSIFWEQPSYLLAHSSVEGTDGRFLREVQPIQN